LPLDSGEKALEIARLALDRKALELVVLDMAGLVMYTDFFVICSGQSTQQVKAIVERIEEGLKGGGIRPQGVEGRTFAHWVLMDYGDVIVHVFEEETREFYELDKLWMDAPRVAVDEDTDILGREDQGRVSRGRG
jgi:ribosome-associated protein